MTGDFTALRYGQPWRSLSGDGMILALFQEVQRLREDKRGSDAEARRERDAAEQKLACLREKLENPQITFTSGQTQPTLWNATRMLQQALMDESLYGEGIIRISKGQIERVHPSLVAIKTP